MYPYGLEAENAARGSCERTRRRKKQERSSERRTKHWPMGKRG